MPPRRPDSGEQLLTLIDPLIRSYPPDIREELRGEIAIAVLGHATVGGIRITRKNLNALTVRRIAQPIIRQDRERFFKWISLDHCYDDNGRKLEERLAG